MTMEKTVEAARGKWKGILINFGMDPKFLDGEHGPCVLCGGGKDRFRFDDQDGSGSYYCSVCGPGYGMGLLMKFKGWDFPQAAKAIDGVLGLVHREEKKAERTDQQKRDAIATLWRHCKALAPGQPPWIYLESRCGPLEGYTRHLRYHPALRYGSHGREEYPALVAGIQYADGTGASLHKTFLTPDGRKANVDPVRKVAKCVSMEGASVRLGPVQERLGFAEGIETSICASKIFRLPVWAALSANGLLSAVPPEGVRSILLCADNDRNFVGQAAAFDKAKRLRAQGFDVEVVVPLIAGEDWQDVWSKSVKEQVA